MKISYSGKRKFGRMFVNILSIFVVLAMAFPVAGSASAQEPTARILVSVTHDWFQAENFAPGASITFEIFDAAGGSLLWSDTRPADQMGFVVVEPWEHPVDLRPGQFIVVSDGVTTKELELEAVTLDVFDPSADYLEGTAPGGRLVWVGAGNELYGCSMEVTADPQTGAWSADFTSLPCDLTEDMWAAAQVFDEDGDTSEGNLPLVPTFVVFPEWEAVEGWNWTQDATVHMEIDDPSTLGSPDYSQDAPVVPIPWNPNDIWVRFDFAGLYDVKPGDVVSLSEGAASPSHTVRNLTITGVDDAEDTVSGTADAGAVVNVWPHATGQTLQATAGPDGAWQVDFTDIFDLVPGEGGRAQINDDLGNGTAVDWHVFNPHFTVFPEWEWFDGLDWPDGATVTITVDGKPECQTTKESSGGFFNGPFGAGCDLVIGDTVTFTDGRTTLTHVVRNLDVPAVDPKRDVIKGVADPGALVYVWPHDPSFEPVQVVADASGNWRVDFGRVGYDLQESMSGRSEIRDEAGNATAVDWYVPHPRFSAFPELERIEGWDWRPGTTVRLIIDDPSTPGKRDYHQAQPVVPTPWDPDVWWVTFDFAGAYDLKAGDVVTLTDGQTKRTHTVQHLTITAVDPEQDTVSGIADPNAQVHVWPHATGQEVVATADGEGNWQVDFTDIFDLRPNEGGRAEIRDAQGNATAVEWRVPNPRFTVFPEWDSVEGYEWPQGATVTASIEGNPACVAEGVADYPEWDPWNTFVALNFPEGCDVQAGDVVMFSDGMTTITHTVQNLHITGVDPTEDLVSGTADANVLVHVWPHATGQQLQVQADSTGAWQADFTGVFDLAPGEGGRSEIRDEAGNATAVDWYVLNPRIVASIPEDWFYLNEFTPNATVNFSVYESHGGTLIAEGTTTTDDSGGIWVDAEGRWDFEPGTYLVVSDGTYTKDLVIEGFTFDVFDVRRGRLKGTAPEPFGRRVWVGIGFGDGGWFMDVTTNKKGEWIADFNAPVPNGYDWVAAQIFDPDGDATELRPARIRD